MHFPNSTARRAVVSKTVAALPTFAFKNRHDRTPQKPLEQCYATPAWGATGIAVTLPQSIAEHNDQIGSSIAGA